MSKYVIYALVVTMFTSCSTWMRGFSGRNYRGGGSSWSSHPGGGGGSFGGGSGGGGHK